MRTSILAATIALLMAMGAVGAVSHQAPDTQEDEAAWCNG